MIRIIALAATLLTLAACSPCCIHRGSTVSRVSRETTPGGIEYTLFQMPDADHVSLQMAWPTDWTYRAETNKAAPVVGVKLLPLGRGEGEYPGKTFRRFKELKVDETIYVLASDYIGNRLTVPRDKLAETVKTVNAFLRAPTLDPGMFELVRDLVAKEFAEMRAQPVPASLDTAVSAIFGAQPLRNAIYLDGPGTFETLTREDVAAWHAETFTRPPEAIVVAGGIAPGAAGVALDSLLEGLPEPRRRALSRKVTENFTPRRILLHLPDAKVSNIFFFAPLPLARLGIIPEDEILSLALSAGSQEVVLKAADDASFKFNGRTFSLTSKNRILFASAEIKVGKLAEAERAIRESYARFLLEVPQSLEEHKRRTNSIFSKYAGFPVELAEIELRNALSGFPPWWMVRWHGEVDAVTQKMVMNRLNKGFPAPDSLSVIVISSDANALPGACAIKTPREAANCR